MICPDRLAKRTLPGEGYFVAGSDEERGPGTGAVWKGMGARGACCLPKPQLVSRRSLSHSIHLISCLLILALCIISAEGMYPFFTFFIPL